MRNKELEILKTLFKHFDPSPEGAQEKLEPIQNDDHIPTSENNGSISTQINKECLPAGAGGSFGVISIFRKLEGVKRKIRSYRLLF